MCIRRNSDVRFICAALTQTWILIFLEWNWNQRGAQSATRGVGDHSVYKSAYGWQQAGTDYTLATTGCLNGSIARTRNQFQSLSLCVTGGCHPIDIIAKGIHHHLEARTYAQPHILPLVYYLNNGLRTMNQDDRGASRRDMRSPSARTSANVHTPRE